MWIVIAIIVHIHVLVKWIFRPWIFRPKGEADTSCEALVPDLAGEALATDACDVVSAVEKVVGTYAR